MADKPFPTTEGDLNVFVQNFKVKIVAYVVVLNLLASEISALGDDALNFNYIVNFAQQVEDSKDAFYAFKDELINGGIATAPLIVPTFAPVDMPKEPIAGIKKRLRGLIARIKASAGYTQQIGEDLGLVENDPGSLNPDTLNADIKPRAIADGKVEITFSKQGMSAMRVDFRRKGDVKYEFAGLYPSSPAIHDEPSVPPDVPEQREYRGILIKKNDPIGNVSPSYTIVTTP